MVINDSLQRKDVMHRHPSLWACPLDVGYSHPYVIGGMGLYGGTSWDESTKNVTCDFPGILALHLDADVVHS